jgi:UrcA family protein
MRSITPFIAAAIGAMSIAQPAAAATSVAVEYHDLDLTTKQGQQELDKRLLRAAKQVCKVHGVQTGSIVQSSVDQDCVKQALAQSREQVVAQIQKEKAAGG